jgi:hypothetical protein
MSIEDQIQELEKQVSKLEESNVQLEMFLQEEEESLYRESIVENEELIWRKTEKIASLKLLLEKNEAIPAGLGPLDD